MNRILLLFVPMLLLISCEDDPLKKVEVTEEIPEMKFLRFDRDVFNIDFSKPAEESKRMEEKYGSFWCEYVENILNIGPCGFDTTAMELRYFTTHADMAEVYRQIKKVHTDEAFQSVNEELTRAFQYYHHYFPDSLIPEIVYFHSGMNYKTYPVDSILAIGIDLYLGYENELVQSLPPEFFPDYKRRDMQSYYIASDAMLGWLLVQNQHLFKTKDLLSAICSYGKCYYLLDAMMPHVPDSIKMNWTSSETEWAEAHTVNTWKELAKQEVLFNSSETEIAKWVDIGPFTSAGNVPQESPAQLGIWMGWQIVRAYMKANPEITVQELMSKNDFQSMLKFYRPDA